MVPCTVRNMMLQYNRRIDRQIVKHILIIIIQYCRCVENTESLGKLEYLGAS